MVTGGGGGNGNPFERPAEDVLDEVQSDYITAAQAQAEYGVVLSPDSRQIDQAATSKLRRRASV
jgi:N-methylhydantoinase B